MRTFIIGRIVVSSALALTLLAVYPSAQPTPTVRWSDGRLSVHAQRAPVAFVLDEVSRQTGVRLRGIEKLTGTLTVDVAHRPLLEVLRVLLEDFNYVMAGDPASGELTIRIHSRVATSTAPDEVEADRLTGPDDDWAGDTDEGVDSADKEQEERLAAAARLTTADGEALAAAARSGPASVRIAALEAMAERDPKAGADAAANAVNDPDPVVSGAALQVLSQIDHPQATKALGGTLQHPNPAVRLAALELLFLRTDPDSLGDVQPLLDDPESAVRARALELVKMLERMSKGK